MGPLFGAVLGLSVKIKPDDRQYKNFYFKFGWPPRFLSSTIALLIFVMLAFQPYVPAIRLVNFMDCHFDRKTIIDELLHYPPNISSHVVFLFYSKLGIRPLLY